MNVNLTPNITGKNVNIIKGATQADLTNSVNNSKIYRDEAEAFSIVSEAKSVEASYSALNASVSATTASDKATIATTKANEANNSAINASASEAVCIAKATITTDKANIATAQSVIATNKANEASVSANTATTQAGIAITKASEASTSASNALTSENNADTSEANALTYRNQAESFANSINPSNLVHISGTETITGNKTFSGTVSGLTKATVGLNNVDNTSDANKPISTATQNALNTKVDTTTNQTIAGVKTFSSTISGSISGNAGTATKLATARTINGVSFDGTANIVAPTNLTVGTRTTTAVPIESSSGTSASIPAASTTLAGVMTSADKVKLDGIASDANNYVLPARLSSTPKDIGDWNLAVENGWYQGYNTLNAPNADWNLGIVEAHHPTWATQTVHAFTSDSSSNSAVWRRQQNGGTWGNWYRLQLTQEEQDARYVNLTGNQNIDGIKTFSSSPIVPTPTTGDNSTKVATTSFVNSEVGTANSSLVKTALNAIGVAPIYACRAWVNFNGIGAVSIRASGNVSSITDNGVGDYTVNFTTAMPDANYAIIGAVKDDTDDPAAITWNRRANTTNTTTQSRFVTGYTGTQYDCPQVDVTVVR